MRIKRGLWTNWCSIVAQFKQETKVSNFRKFGRHKLHTLLAIQGIEVILYARDQQRSRDFYASVLELAPTLDVPGMTEFNIGETKLGLMPEAGIRSLLGLSSGELAASDSRLVCELYLSVDDPVQYADRALKYGATMLSAYSMRDWGDSVVYVVDPDGHVLAFAHKVYPD
jgi:predicted enzyme related to lactoylglutathione lyase